MREIGKLPHILVSQISPEIKIPPADDEWKSHKLPRQVKRY